MTATKTACTMSRNTFATKAGKLPTELAGKTAQSAPRIFKTGSMGWYVGGKVSVKADTKDGPKAGLYQLSCNITVIGSKHMPAEKLSDEAVATLASWKGVVPAVAFTDNAGGLTAAEFLLHAKPLTVGVGGERFSAEPRRFASDSVGYYYSGKITAAVDGKAVRCQVGLNLTLIGSKEEVAAAPAQPTTPAEAPAPVKLTAAEKAAQGFASSDAAKAK